MPPLKINRSAGRIVMIQPVTRAAFEGGEVSMGMRGGGWGKSGRQGGVVFRRALEHAREVGLFRTDMSERQGATEAGGGGAFVLEAPMQFARDGVQEIVRFEA